MPRGLQQVNNCLTGERMTADPTVLHPAPSNWFHTAIEYEGLGRAEFLDPQGAAVGPVQIRFDEFGETFVQMNVEKVESPRPLQFGLMELLRGCETNLFKCYDRP
jgi:hypothetical protein